MEDKLTRRDALKLSAAAVAAGVLSGRGIAQAPPVVERIRGKKLLERGQPDVYSGEELNFIGMPIGGLFSGTVYLGGDGQLWNWDIFNQGFFGCTQRPDTVFMGETLGAGSGANYVDPVKQQSPFHQRFVLIAEKPWRRQVKFADIKFRGEYPLARVSFADSDADVEMSLEAFSPFIPLDVERSSFPATTQTYTIKNVGAEPAQFQFHYASENPVLIYSRKGLKDFKPTATQTTGNGVLFSADGVHDTGDFGTFCVEIIGGANDSEIKPDQAEIGSSFTLAPGETRTLTFVVAWHFPKCWKDLPGKRNWYSTKWSDAAHVAADLIQQWPGLSKTTKLWNKTWYDSSLPYWFLDRTFANTSILATTTANRLDEGRFYFWEGSGCCAGTCTHVYGYAQAIGRVFPQVERYLRSEIDYKKAFHPDSGAIDYRCEFGQNVAVDGQASCIMRACREHMMSSNNSFLSSRWPQIKKSMEYLINQDMDRDGILDGPQYNTLDATWYGEISWTSSLYLGALRASEFMATEMGDTAFGAVCADLIAKGSKNMPAKLFNGEYFINIADKAHPEANNTNLGCHIDQVYGQSWVHQLGLQRILPQAECRKALNALFKYNFYEDVWEYRRKNRAIPGGRWYATPKEAGLIMCSFPKGDGAQSVGKGQEAWASMYFNECMSGFEHQVAAHMIAEGLVEKGLTIERAIHERYHASKRNPYNEVECSDHYGRSMASYGAFISMCGFKCNGPKGEMTFQPKISGPFRSAFINSTGWGTFDRSDEGTETISYSHRTS